MKLFLTGGTGFIGSHLVILLLNEGHEVTVLARNPHKIPMFQQMPGLRLVPGDVRDYDRLSGWLAGQEGVIHLALCWGDSAAEMLRQDTQTTVVLLEKAAEAGVRDFLYTSSTAAFGAYQPHMTEEMKSDPLDWYCATKAASESYAIAASYKFPMRVNIIRPGYTFGAPIAPGSPMGAPGFLDLVQASLKNQDITVEARNGTQFIWADDLARLYSAVLHSNINRQIYHAVSHPWHSWEEVAQLAVQLTHSSSRLIVTGSSRHSTPDLFDVSKMERDFGLQFDPWPHIIELITYLIKTV